MGRIYLRTLADCIDKGAILAVKCGSCVRVVYVAPYDLIQRAKKRGLITASSYLGDVERALIFRAGQGSIGCGAKEAGVRAVWSHEVRGVPRGIPVLICLMQTIASGSG